MQLNKLVLALSLAALALPMSAMAQDTATDAPASNFSWNVELTSDYVFRGISQTDRKPALQGGLDYSFGDSGWAIGTWGSNVDFGSGSPDLEVDTYISWGHDLNDDWNLNLMLDRYNYLGESSSFGSIDYNEYIGKLTYNDMITLTAVYADNYANLDYSETYFNVSGNWDIGNDYTFNAGIGHTEFSDGIDGYGDWTIGVGKQFGPMHASLNYYDTDVNGGHLSDQIVLTLGFGG